jgi:signal transduction histidine kinase
MDLNVVQISSIIITFFTFILAMMSWVNRKQESIYAIFSLFMITHTAQSIFSFIMAGSETPEEAFYWVRYSILINGFTFLIFIIYSLKLTGYNKKLGKKILGVSIKRYLIISLSCMLIGFYFLLLTDLVVIGCIYQPGGYYEVVWSNGIYFLELFAVCVLVYIFRILIVAIKESERGYRRTFLKSNLYALILLLSAGPILGIMLPGLGIPSSPFVDFATVIASIMFYLAINRYQISTIEALRAGLEQKVIDRTKHLHATQAKLLQSEKMASLSNLIAGVAHEMNTPIGAIYSCHDTLEKASSKLRKSLEGQEDVITLPGVFRPLKAIENSARIIKDGGERVTQIVSRMKNFVQLDEAELQRADIHIGLDDTIEIFRHELKPGVELSQEFGVIPEITCYPAKLNQACLLILDNANRSIKDEGKIEVSTASENGVISIIISDTGRGIAKDHLSKIFDPGFSKWDIGVGVGLGLAICYQIIQEHKGSIEVNSIVDKGTTFSISIPDNLQEKS